MKLILCYYAVRRRSCGACTQKRWAIYSFTRSQNWRIVWSGHVCVDGLASSWEIAQQPLESHQIQSGVMQRIGSVCKSLTLCSCPVLVKHELLSFRSCVCRVHRRDKRRRNWRGSSHSTWRRKSCLPTTAVSWILHWVQFNSLCRWFTLQIVKLTHSLHMWRIERHIRSTPTIELNIPPFTESNLQTPSACRNSDSQEI